VDHADHVRLIRDGVTGAGPAWADLGSGKGAFTLALADILGPSGTIITVDRDRGALEVQLRRLRAQFSAVAVTPIVADFTNPIEVSELDGIVMANSLHFVRDKGPVLELVRGYLRPGGRLILVEYGADRGNPYVPYPVSFAAWAKVAAAAGFRETRQLASVPSRFLGSIYSALSLR
jgi:ubiquinone/menaquinone biosynthesis C-methylase UbiE